MCGMLIRRATTSAPPASKETGSETPKTPEAEENVGEAPEPTASPAEQPTTPAPSREDSQPSENGKVRASPMARHIAAEHGLNLSDIAGSGPQGRVVRADVEAALQGEAKPAEVGEQPAPAPQVPSADGEERQRWGS